MADFYHVPVVSVDKNNINQLWPSLKLAISSSSFIAIDTELSGLGDRDSLNATCIEDRYSSVVKTAKSRAIISIGLSCFKHQKRKNEEESSSRWNFVVQTFNILALCNEEYVVEPGALNFLIQHGFDFNKQYAAGLPFHRGSDKPNGTDHSSLRNILEEMICHKKPVIVHNGFVDMIFLYQNLYADAPKSLSTFLADLCEMFPTGIYDTKFIAEYRNRTNASYLEYIFKKSKMVNSEASVNGYVKVSFPNYDSKCPYVENRFCGSSEYESDHSKICNNYSQFGFCVKENCSESHNVDRILKEENKKKRKKKKLKTDNASEEAPMDDSNKAENGVKEMFGHRAGFDAFMTGFAFATYVAKFGTYPQDDSVDFNGILSNIENFSNKLFLTRKDFPLSVSKSNFTKNSTEHVKKLSKICDT